MTTETPRTPLDAVRVEENFGKTLSGWWWGVWQDGRLVGFGAGYRNKRTCFSHQKATAKAAAKDTLPAVKCSNPSVERPRPYRREP